MTTKIILTRKWNDGISNDVHFIWSVDETHTHNIELIKCQKN